MDIGNVQDTFVTRAHSAGKTLMMCPQGTRGDVQPFVALANAFQKAGFNVIIMTSVNHRSFVESFGISFNKLGIDTEWFFNQPMVKTWMTNGEMLKLAEYIGKNNKVFLPGFVTELINGVDANKPDLLFVTMVGFCEILALGRAKNIPVLPTFFNAFLPSKHVRTWLGEPSWFPHRMCGTLFLSLFLGGELAFKNSELLRQCPETNETIFLNFQEIMLEFAMPITPVLVACSPNLYHVQPDWPEEFTSNVLFTGCWVVSPEEQQTRIQRGDSNFGGDTLPELSAFLEKVVKPVYIGWGSMMWKSPQHMTYLAVHALMKANFNGIVLGGWAEISLDKLDGQPDTNTMKSYCEDHVLFMKTAPHEWLFPQCSVIVHHGGAGTTAAALRAGVPTVVTPCFFDQFEHALLVERNGLGILPTALGKLTVSQLAQAMVTCTADRQMNERAVAMGLKLRAENGLAIAVKAVDDFIVCQLDTGKYAATKAERSQQVAKLRSKPALGCLAWTCGLLCFSSWHRLLRLPQ